MNIVTKAVLNHREDNRWLRIPLGDRFYLNYYRDAYNERAWTYQLYLSYAVDESQPRFDKEVGDVYMGDSIVDLLAQTETFDLDKAKSYFLIRMWAGKVA